MPEPAIPNTEAPMPLDPNRPLAEQPLYRVQEQAARGNADAVADLGRRYAAAKTLYRTDSYRARVAAMYARGWNGEADPYKYGRGGNFAALLRDAYQAGVEDHKNLSALVAASDREKAGAS